MNVSKAYTGDLSKWWRTASAKAAMRRAEKAKKARLKALRQKKENKPK